MANLGLGSTSHPTMQSAATRLPTLRDLAQASLGVGSVHNTEPNPAEDWDDPSNPHDASKSVLSSYWFHRVESFILNGDLSFCCIISYTFDL